MLVEQKKDNHLFITLNKKEYITIYSVDKKIRLLIEYKKGELTITHFRTKE